jgi:hypothetical protein
MGEAVQIFVGVVVTVIQQFVAGPGRRTSEKIRNPVLNPGRTFFGTEPEERPVGSEE